MRKGELIERLHAFHARNGYDISLLFEEEPELYRAVVVRDAGLVDDSIGSEFLRLVAKVTASATRDAAYKSSFDRAQQVSKGKAGMSIGFIPDNEDE